MRLKRNVIKGITAVSCTALLAFGATAYEAKPFQGRIAITTDGNQHDHDDYGASSVSMLLLAKAKLQDKLVHFDYNSHIEDSVAAREDIMTESIIGAKTRFGGFSDDVFFDDTKQLQASINNIKKIVNESSADNPLYFVLGGPAEVLYRGLKAADPEKRKHVILVSHSWWNETHAGPAQPEFYNPKDHVELLHTVSDLVELGVTYRPINEQNKYFNTQKVWEKLDWMKDHKDGRIRWVYSRIQKVGRPDYSDAGMTWYAITKNDRGSVDLLEDFIGTNWLYATAPAYPPVVEPLQEPGLEPVAGKKIRLKNRGNGKYVNADKMISSIEPPLMANSYSATPWTQYKVVDAGGGYVALQAMVNDLYVKFQDGRLRAVNTTIDDNARFKFSKNVDGSYFIYSKATFKYVNANKMADPVNWPLDPNKAQITGSWGRFDVKR